LKEIHTRIEIDASTKVIWRILTDLENYHAWNPFIPEAVGRLSPGGMLAIKIKVPGREAQDYKVRILKIDEEREFRWLGHFHVPGLIDGDHRFELRPIGANKSELVQREHFRGILVPFTWKTFLNTRLREGFEMLNRSLKTTAESSTARG
jgi:hypothetical protein